MGRLPSGAVLDLGSLRSPAGKKPFTAHFDGGARNVARNLVGQLTPSPVRAPVLTFFRRQNERAFFPSLPIAALLPRRWRLANSKECQLGCYSVAWVFSRRKKTLSIWCKICPISAGWEALMCLKYFCNKKGQHGFKSMLSFFASHEACRRMAAFSIQLTESHTEPASHGACCATAVKDRKSTRLNSSHNNQSRMPSSA